jgi:hypothetical protein
VSKSCVPQPFQIEEINFRTCFSAPSLRHFMLLMTGWVLTVGKHTISNVIAAMQLHEVENFVTIYRFFSRAIWNPDHVGERIFEMVVSMLLPHGSEVVVVLDDTLNKHRGKKICGAGWQHDGSAPKHSRQMAYGLCFVVIGLAVRLPGISDRIFCLPFAARLWWPQSVKVPPKRQVRKTKPQLAASLVRLARSWLDTGRRLRVVGDISYTCEAVIRDRPDGVHFTGRVRKDSALFEPPVLPIERPRGRPRTKGKRLPTPEEMFNDVTLPWREVRVTAYGKETVLHVYHLLAVWYYVLGPQIVAFVLVRDPSGTHADAVFFDTDPCALPEQIVARYSARWSIEITYRETKQLLGSADPQCRSELSVERAGMMAYWAYSLVILWFVCHFQTAKQLVTPRNPWYKHKRTITFSDMLAAVRRSHFIVGFSREAGNTGSSTENRWTRSTRHQQYTKSAKL